MFSKNRSSAVATGPTTSLFVATGLLAIALMIFAAVRSGAIEGFNQSGLLGQ